jgi:hypothetical protein
MKMNEDKKHRLEEAGFQVGSVADFLQLSPEEQARIEKLVVHEKTVKSKIDDLRIMGWLLMVGGIMIGISTWNKIGGLTSDFILGALCAWSIRTASAYFRKAEDLG